MMTAPGVRALAIARPTRQDLAAHPFSGRVVGHYERACTLADGSGRIIALTAPSVGKGPFSIVVDADGQGGGVGGQGSGDAHAVGDLFAGLAMGQSVHIDADTIDFGGCCVSLRDVPVWDATLPSVARPLGPTPALAAALCPYTTWPRPCHATPVGAAAERGLAQATHGLMAAVERGRGVAAAAQHLAGLGPGLTPAGDDYVLGVMAALWLLDERDPLPAIAAACAPRTTRLSGAFVRAAAQGQFMEPWHHLAHALDQEDEPGSRHAVRRIAGFGASSGRDALAGFAQTLTRRAHVISALV